MICLIILIDETEKYFGHAMSQLKWHVSFSQFFAFTLSHKLKTTSVSIKTFFKMRCFLLFLKKCFGISVILCLATPE